MTANSNASGPVERLFNKSGNETLGKLALPPLILGAGVFGTGELD